MLKLKDLLKNGFFAKELPPPFTTEIFVSKYDNIYRNWKNNGKSILKNNRESKCVKYTIPKIGFARRLIGIPNPLHQTELCKSICDNWADIEKIYDLSKISASKATIDKSQDRAVTTIKTYREFKHECILNSFDKLYRFKTDISRYYSSIYTHIIPWLIHGKVTAKAQRNDYSLLGNILDRKVV